MPELPNLRALREQKLMSQGELAARSGLSRVTISRLENGRTQASYTTIRKLAEAMDVPRTALVDGDDAATRARRQEPQRVREEAANPD